jgi:hypothetical protein
MNKCYFCGAEFYGDICYDPDCVKKRREELKRRLDAVKMTVPKTDYGTLYEVVLQWGHSVKDSPKSAEELKAELKTLVEGHGWTFEEFDKAWQQRNAF